MGILTKEQIRQLIKEKNMKTAQDVQETLKEMFAETLQEMLEAELEEELGYSKYDYKNKKTSNSRNGHSKKKVHCFAVKEYIASLLLFRFIPF
jgi:putative transposase